MSISSIKYCGRYFWFLLEVTAAEGWFSMELEEA